MEKEDYFELENAAAHMQGADPDARIIAAALMLLRRQVFDTGREIVGAIERNR